MTPLPCEVRFTDDEMRRAAALHFQARLGKRWKLTRLLAWLVLATGLWILRYEWWPLSAFFIATGLILLLVKRLFLRRCLRAFRQSPFHGETHTWTLHNDHFLIQRPGQESKLALGKISAAEAGDEGFLVYTGETTFFWLPKRGFETAESYHEARSHVLNSLKANA